MPSVIMLLCLLIGLNLFMGFIVMASLTCSLPSNPSNGQVQTRWNGYIVQYGCQTGFQLIGMSTATCQSNGQWSHPKPICQQIASKERVKKNAPSNRQYSVLRSLSDLQYGQEYNLPANSRSSRLLLKSKRPLFSWDDTYVSSPISQKSKTNSLPLIKSFKNPIKDKKSLQMKLNDHRKSNLKKTLDQQQPLNDNSTKNLTIIKTVIDDDKKSSDSINNFTPIVNYVDLDLASLDTSCIVQDIDNFKVTITAPNINNAVIDVYRRRHNPEEPFNIYMEAFYLCSDGFRMRKPLVHSVYCSGRMWTGLLPECLPRNSSDNPLDVGIEDDDPEIGPEVYNQVSCDNENGGCQHVCQRHQNGDQKLNYCSCYEGFTIEDDGLSCKDIDECSSSNDTCEHQCWNIPGSYICSCPDGYAITSDRKSCVDKNECLSRNGHGPCQDVCINSDGSYECSCSIAGTQLASDNHTCEDIDECSLMNFNCSHGCLNTIGTAFCICPDGFMLGEDYKTCEDVDECQFPEMVKSCKDDEECVNTVGSYKCGISSFDAAEEVFLTPAEDFDQETMDDTNITTPEMDCHQGYRKDDHDQCNDVNECQIQNFGCSHNCINSPGSASCSCQPGFNLLEDWKTCEDVDECSDANFGCSDACINTLGSAHCLCPSGFKLNSDNKTCQEIEIFIICPVPSMTTIVVRGQNNAHVRLPEPKSNLDPYKIQVKPVWIRDLEGEFPIGQTTVTFYQIDPHQSERNSTCNIIVTVLDKEPPSVVTCPNPIRKSIDQNQSTILIDWPEPNFTDNDRIDYLWKSKEPGLYAPGFYNVEYIARDPSGNSAHCAFTIEITPIPMTVQSPISQSYPLVVGRIENPHPPARCPNAASKHGNCPILNNDQMDLLRTLYWAFTKGCLSDRLPLLKSLAVGRKTQNQPAISLAPVAKVRLLRVYPNGAADSDSIKKFNIKADHSKYNYANNVFKPLSFFNSATKPKQLTF